jgi:putative PEP-CTERM system histidine kinase
MAGVFQPILSNWTALRRRFGAFVSKSLLRGRYDYREVWLRLSRTLAGGSDEASLPDRSVQALGAIIGSPRGELWLVGGVAQVYEGRGAWSMPRPDGVITGDDPLIRFLEQTHWVLDTHEYASDPGRYANAFDADDSVVVEPSIIVPLVHEDGLIGLVRLDRPAGLGDLSFEDHDLLKTAGQQVAIFLMHERSQEELSETRQFEAFSKLTAFLMHDLKNMIAQQELVVGNAKRFKHRPEFIDDAIQTIEASVHRMRRLLERLGDDGGVRSTLIDLPSLLREVRDACTDQHPAPQLGLVEPGIFVTMDRDRLSMAVMHAVRNAQDATPSDGHIELELKAEEGYAIIDISDTGKGMEPAFVRERLFRPFDSTKGARGMGIGAYQIRETLRMADGDVVVTSIPGHGTLLRMKIPLAMADRRLSRNSVA